MRIHIVGDYQPAPAEGMQVVVKTLVDGLRDVGHDVIVIPPGLGLRQIGRFLAVGADRVVFVHGPGSGVVAASWALRAASRARILWVATRPDLETVPRFLRGRRTAHGIICNVMRDDLREVAKEAELIQTFIGIEPSRLRHGSLAADAPGERVRSGRPTILHVGHLRSNRGLDLLAEAKTRLGDDAEVVVQGSPTFAADADLVRMLTEVGVQVRTGYVDNLSDLYAEADLYVFPARPEHSGAIDLPLGALEAVACHLPILVNEFGALRPALSNVDGVHFTRTETLVDDLVRLVRTPGALDVRPPGLPSHLHASRVTDAVLAWAETS